MAALAGCSLVDLSSYEQGPDPAASGGQAQGGFGGLVSDAMSAAGAGQPSGGRSDTGDVEMSGGGADGGAPADVGGAGGGTTGGALSGGGSGGTGGNTEPVPGDVINLKNWRLSLPVPSGNPDSKPLEISPPKLATYRLDPFFRLNSTKDGVILSARADGYTYSDSAYARCELRELTEDGRATMAWSTTSGTHSLALEAAITHAPLVVPRMIVAQLRNATDDLLTVRVEGVRISVEHDGTELGVLEENYVLGTRFHLKVAASNGRVQVFYNDAKVPKVDVARAASDCYFRTGVYLQTNTLKGDPPESYGEVVFNQLAVSHT